MRRVAQVGVLLAMLGVIAATAAGSDAREKPPMLQILPADQLPTGAVPLQMESAKELLTFTARLPESGEGPGAQAQLRHGFIDPTHLWVPHLTPEPGYVIGDHSFRSPALVFSDDRSALALIPDLDDVEAARRSGLRVWLDYDHPEQRITVAVGNYVTGGFHVGYRAAPAKYAGQSIRLRVHVLRSRAPKDVENPYGMAASWLWQRWGHAGYTAGGSQQAPLSRYAQYIEKWAFSPAGWEETVWQRFRIGDEEVGAPAFIVDVAQHPSIPVEQRRWREQKSVWNQAWFSTQRCANGLLRYARQIGSRELEERARRMTRVALLAPQRDGLFPSVYTAGGGGYRLYRETPDWSAGRWTNSDRRPPGISAQAYHLLDAAFTARLLLEWHDLVGETETAAVPYVRRFADRLCRLQLSNGGFPGWVEPDGRVSEPHFEGPETAMSASLLLELAERFPREDRYRDAAVKALRYLEEGPVRESRWEDFETYYSCSRWGAEDQVGKRVARSGVYKANSFSPFWCADAFLLADRVLHEKRYLSVGRRCLDELSLFQQVWSPSWLPAACHGGFGVMNADGEWNDARQSLFAPLYLDYYQATGNPEYFERGVSALRASFAMLYCPENREVRRAYERTHPFFGPESYGFMMENIAHGGPGANEIGPFTIFTWGNGAALAAAANIRDRYGDLYVDTRRKRAFGIDGCQVELDGETVKVRDRFPGRGRPLVAKYEGDKVRVVPEAGELPLQAR